MAQTVGSSNTRLANVPIQVYGAQAAVLNGQVYLLGGINCTGVAAGNNGTATNSVLVYNPATNTWSSGPPMPTALALNFSAVTVNGKIFVISGTSVWEYAPPVYMFSAN